MSKVSAKENKDELITPVATPLSSIEEVTPGWLSTVLGSEVESIESKKIGTGQMSNTYRIFLHYSSSSTSHPKPKNNSNPVSPPTLILKLAPASPSARKSALRYGLSEREVRFYQDLNLHLNLTSISRCYFSAFDREDGRFTLLLSDAGLDARPGNDLAGATKEQARTAVRELGKFHGQVLRLGDGFRIAEKEWLKRIPMSGAVLGLMFGGFWQRYGGREEGKGGLGKEEWELVGRFVEGFDAWQDLQTEGDEQVMGLMHCDFRMDNLLFNSVADGEGVKVTIVDWQTVQVGPIVSDLAYFLAGSLKTEDRREWMKELVDVYVQGVNGENSKGENGAIDREIVMKGLRERAWVGVIGSIVGAMIGERSERGDMMLVEMMRRSCAMIRDLAAVKDLPQVSGGWWSWVVSLMGVLGRVLEVAGRWG